MILCEALHELKRTKKQGINLRKLMKKVNLNCFEIGDANERFHL